MTLTVEALQNAEQDVATLSAVVNDGPGSADVITRFGRSIKPLQKMLFEMQAEFDAALLDMDGQITATLAAHGYEPPVAYAAGINVVRSSQTVSQGGIVYAPVIAALPFVTGAVLDATKWYQLPKTQVTVGLAGLKNLAPQDGDGVYVLDRRRYGWFEFYSAARIVATFPGTTYADWKTRDPGEGCFVAPAAAPTGAAGMWIRKDDRLHVRMFGAGETADDTEVIRRITHLSCFLKLPCWSDESFVMRWGLALNTNMKVGTLDNSNPPAGRLDGFQMLGTWRFKVKAASECVLEFHDGKRMKFGDIDFDIVSEATKGTGQLRFYACTYVVGGKATKLGTAAVAAGQVTGGSIVSLQPTCEYIYFRSAISEWAGDESAAVFVVMCNNYWFDSVRCVGGQETFDVSGTYPIGGIGKEFWGCRELYAEQLGEACDCGNSPGGLIIKLTGKSIQTALDLKTEPPLAGGLSQGSNRLSILSIDVTDWSNFLVGMEAGATSDQTLNHLFIGVVRATTTIATASTVAFRLREGDNGDDPNRGLIIGQAYIRGNAGATFDVGWLRDFRIENIDSDMPTALVWAGGSAVFQWIEKQNGLWRNCRMNGNFGSYVCRGVTFEDVEVAGLFGVTDGRHNRYIRTGSRNSQTLGFDLFFSTTSPVDRDVDVIDCFAENVGIGGAANQYALGIWRNGASLNVEGIRVKDFVMRDLQRTLAVNSGGVTVPAVGQWILGNTSGARARINKVTLTGGTWAGGDAAANLLLRSVVGEFTAGETLTLGGLPLGGSVTSADFATAVGASVSSPTSAGLRIQNLTPNNCRLEGLHSYGVTNHQAYGFEGARSYNDPSNRLDPLQTVAVGGASSLAMIHANRTMLVTSNSGIVLNGNGAAFPLETVFRIHNRSGANLPLSASNGALLKSAGGLLNIPPNGEAVVRIVATGPLTAQVSGDLV